MDVNFISVFVAALIPLAVGFVWYNPKFLGNAWMQESGMTEEKAKGANHALIFGLTYVFAVLAGMILMPMVIHQMGVMSVLVDEPGFNDPNSELAIWYKGFMEQYGNNFRTFKHGALHGTIAGLFFALPIIAINAMFERKSWKYIWINVGYFTVTFALMGGVICAWK
ncbi:MAG: DUF1761 domain-containing protein [Bacteroidetes bacterium]|nr:DUF1761 domain-containing protein [Bacteroidota bacterium]